MLSVDRKGPRQCGRRSVVVSLYSYFPIDNRQMQKRNKEKALKLDHCPQVQDMLHILNIFGHPPIRISLGVSPKVERRGKHNRRFWLRERQRLLLRIRFQHNRP